MELLKEDQPYFENIKVITLMTADRFGLELKEVVPSVLPRKGKVQHFLGWCSSSGTIKISVRAVENKKWAKARNPDRDILLTVAHELAHLKYMDHGPQHTTLTKSIFNYLFYRKEPNGK